MIAIYVCMYILYILFCDLKIDQGEREGFSTAGCSMGAGKLQAGWYIFLTTRTPSLFEHGVRILYIIFFIIKMILLGVQGVLQPLQHYNIKRA